MAIVKLDLHQKYQPEIFGFGEVYEQISVEKKRKNLEKKFAAGSLFLCANKQQADRGMTLKELITKVKSKDYQILSCGFLDSPWWSSCPRRDKSFFIALPLLIVLAQLIFRILVFFEFLCQGEKKAHLVYVLGRKKK